MERKITDHINNVNGNEEKNGTKDHINNVKTRGKYS
jgi:hypothetical protein